MDIGFSDDMYESFVMYQAKMVKEFRSMEKRYGLVPIDANRLVADVYTDLQKRIDWFLKMTGR